MKPYIAGNIKVNGILTGIRNKVIDDAKVEMRDLSRNL